jgi:hypothetical protein
MALLSLIEEADRVLHHLASNVLITVSFIKLIHGIPMATKIDVTISYK